MPALVKGGKTAHFATAGRIGWFYVDLIHIKSGGSKPPPYVKYACPTEPRPRLTSVFVSTRYFAYAQYDNLLSVILNAVKNLAEAAAVGCFL